MSEFVAVVALAPRAIGVLHGVVVAWALLVGVRWLGLPL